MCVQTIQNWWQLQKLITKSLSGLFVFVCVCVGGVWVCGGVWVGVGVCVCVCVRDFFSVLFCF